LNDADLQHQILGSGSIFRMELTPIKQLLAIGFKEGFFVYFFGFLAGTGRDQKNETTFLIGDENR